MSSCENARGLRARGAIAALGGLRAEEVRAMSAIPSTTTEYPDELDVALTRLVGLEKQLADARRAVEELAELFYNRMTRPAPGAEGRDG
jgi:hypothetical protein